MSNARAARRRSKKAPAPPPAGPVFRLPAHRVAAWLAREGITLEQVAAGDPLTAEEVELEMAREDPVDFALLRLREEADLVGDDGTVWSRRGDGWRLAPIQEQMARLRGDLVFECGAEVGKTRDIVLQALHAVEYRPGVKVLIITNRELTSKAIYRALLTQIRLAYDLGGWRIGGGLDGKPSLADFLLRFRGSAEIELRLYGTAGENLRNAHVDLVLFDEAAMAKDPMIFDLTYRALKPGPENFFRIYSTPDGDYSSPFWGLCNRATPIDGRTFEERTAQTVKQEGEPGFSKFNITKMRLPPPFWTESRAAKLREMYGGESSIGWQTQVLGRWGSPNYSVFPLSTLKPNLRRDLDRYRIVVAVHDRVDGRIRLRAARLGAKDEEILTDETLPFLGGDDLGRAICRFFPEVRDLPERLYCGVDLGSAADPSEFLFVAPDGPVWSDVLRVHLLGVDWNDQEAVFSHLAHAAGHDRVRWCLDRGGPGATVASHLQNSADRTTCPVCRADSGFSTRLIGVNFADGMDEIDPEDGSIVLGDKRNAAGERMPVRMNAKEYATRVLERKAQKAELRIGDDRGAGDSALAAATLLVNHTATGISGRGERKFKGVDDHAVDARRFAALAIALSRAQTGGITANRAADIGVSGTDAARSRTMTRSARDERVEAGTPSGDDGGFGGGSIRRSWGGPGGFGDF